MVDSLEQLITDSLMDTRLDYAFDFLGIAINTKESNQKVIKWKYVSGNRNNRYQKIVLQVGKGFAGIVWKTARPMIVTNFKEELAGPLEEFPIAITENLASLIAVPVLSEQEVIAVLVGGYRKVTEMDDSLMHVLNKTANGLVATIIELKK
ncbi:GAF domain-containing protein [Listeria sp. PSOL-1]|uniref:GAF domain-containing protein n=1 Tax=Listeria sp. PSOL-1 TaxID=1844999 RepID=UPI0013D825F2|nr:GAF domain-containing protein [Listeria sp. PSOL-1]